MGRGALVDRFWAKVEKTAGCWLWTASKDRQGYGYFDHGKAHRFSYVLHYGLISTAKPCVLHRCDNPSCVRPEHLWIGTRQENMVDRDSKGRGYKGDRHWTKDPIRRALRGWRNQK
jgi:hypothetical protein